jgi:hypothetical protein
MILRDRRLPQGAKIAWAVAVLLLLVIGWLAWFLYALLGRRPPKPAVSDSI